VSNLTRRFAAGAVLKSLDLTIARGEFVALLGRSGSGKTTLLRTLAGLDEVTEGEMQVSQKRTVVYQEPRLFPWKRLWRNVALGVRTPDAKQRAEAALREVELPHRLNAWPLTLSGGEAQRVALARALVREPELLLLDEPFASLDALTRTRMQGLVTDLWVRHRPAVLLVTHDIDEALLLADRVLVLSEGRLEVDIPIGGLPRPRDDGDARFISLRHRLRAALGVGQAQPPASAEAHAFRSSGMGIPAVAQ
jgi:sulfonate transport system ATP-binding protein